MKLRIRIRYIITCGPDRSPLHLGVLGASVRLDLFRFGVMATRLLFLGVLSVLAADLVMCRTDILYISDPPQFLLEKSRRINNQTHFRRILELDISKHLLTTFQARPFLLRPVKDAAWATPPALPHVCSTSTGSR